MRYVVMVQGGRYWVTGTRYTEFQSNARQFTDLAEAKKEAAKHPGGRVCGGRLGTYYHLIPTE